MKVSQVGGVSTEHLFIPWKTADSEKNGLPGVLLSPLPPGPAHLHNSVRLDGIRRVWRKVIAKHSPPDFPWPFLGKEVMNNPTSPQAGHSKTFPSPLKHHDRALLLQLPYSVPSGLLLSHDSNMSLLPWMLWCSGAAFHASLSSLIRNISFSILIFLSGSVIQ